MSQAWSIQDPTTSSSLDGTISKLPGKLDRLLRHGCTLPKGVADELPFIKGDLEKIVAISSDLEDDHAMLASCWRKEVRELSYDMEDFVDQYEHARAVSCSSSRSMVRGRKIVTRQRRESKTDLPWLREKLRQRLWMANKIREFSRRTQEALQRHSLYNLGAIAGASASSRRISAYSDPAWNSTPCCEENAYVGISDAMEELSMMMMHDDHEHQKLKVVSIVGFGGIGKTTLATELYRNLGQQFECRAFVRTSQKPDMRRIFISMLSQVRPHQPPDNWTVHSLISTIRTHLQDKRYLIIVEDLCTTSTWDIVKYALPDSNRCSRILITTEIEDLALQSCDHDPKCVYKMKPLGEDNSRKLFFGSVFGHQHDCPPKLRKISCNIISKCGGLPLAIVTVASILSNQPGVQGQWDYVNKSIGESLLTNPTWEGMKQVLDLSYNSLPKQLKACILYTSLYEEDIIIWKDDLINQWIAEGFIQTEEQDKKEIGRSFFDRLISGKLILPVDINRNDEVLSCMVHRMVLDLVIREKSMEENFVTAIHHSQAGTTLADKVRRLSLQFGNAEDATPPSNMRLSHIRTLAFSGVFKCLPSIEQFRRLQVLILHFWGDKDTISFDITRISELFRLRYLKVTSNVTLELGTQMPCLQSLETLEIDARVSAVPSDIVQLPGLLHLRLPAETNLPNGIGHMTSLRTLGYFDLSSNSVVNVYGLSALTNLGDLQLTCSTEEIESLNMKTPLSVLMNMILERLSNLKSLTLVPTKTSSYYTKCIDDDTGFEVSPRISEDSNTLSSVPALLQCFENLNTLSSVPALLQSFEVSPRICIFLCTPKWIGQLHKLSILKFGVRKIDRDGVDVLRGLPGLAILSLYVHTKPAARVIIGKTGFPVIKYFKFKCCDPCLNFEEGAMPNLRHLKLAFNACNADQPITMPVGINHLSELKEASAKIGGAGPEESHTRAVELAFRNAMGCQRVNVKCVNQIVGGEDDQSIQSSMTTAGYPQIQYPPSPAQAPAQKHKQKRQGIDSRSRKLSETSSTLLGRTVAIESRKQSHMPAVGTLFTNNQAVEHTRSSETSVSPRKEFHFQNLDLAIHLQNLDLANNRTTYCRGRKSTEIVFSTQVPTSPPSSRGHHYQNSPVPSRTFGQCPASTTSWQDDSRSSSSPQPLPLPPGSPCLPSRSLQWKKGKLLGSGTFGQVYIGFNSEGGQMCAIKEVKVISDDSNSKECLRQLNQEIILLSQLSHPNIVQYYGSDLSNETLSVYLEYVSGGSIHKLLQEYGPFGEAALRNYTAQILSGLAYLHGRNTVHRDIKGANILVDPNGDIKLADFGMAKHISAYIKSFKSPYWMAPEVIKNSNGYSLSVDIWSLGCTILEMATAKPPWSQYEGVAAMFKIGNSKDIPDIPDNLSSEAKSFLKLCLQRDPAARPTAAQLMDHPFVKGERIVCKPGILCKL